MRIPRLTAMVAGRRLKWLMLVLWLGLIVVLYPLAGKLTAVEKNDTISWLPRNSEATRAFQRAEGAFPGSDKLVAVVVYARDTRLTEADQAKVTQDRQAFLPLALDNQIKMVVPSHDGQAALMAFPLGGDDKQQKAAVETIRATISTGVPAGLHVALTGSAGAAYDIANAFSNLDSTLLLTTIGMVALILLITYRSPMLWLVPLLSVFVASQVVSAMVYLLVRHTGLTVTGQSQSIMTVLVFGAGTDYALLLIARYREELRRISSRHEAMAIALRRSYPVLLASAGAVTIGLLCLLAAEMNSTRGLGPVGAIGIIIALITMTTLLPALLVIFGRWLFWPFVPRYAQDAEAIGVTKVKEYRFWGRISGWIGRRPRAIWLGTLAALIALSLGVLNLSLGLPASEQFTTKVDSVVGQQLVAAHYPSGASYPVQILAAAPSAQAVSDVVQSVPGVAMVQPPEVSTDRQLVRISAILAERPDSQAAKDTTERIRNAVHAVPDAQALVGGATATQLDTEHATARDNWLLVPLILSVIFIVLILLLRALVAPLLLIMSVVISFGTAMGTAGFVLTWLGHTKLALSQPLICLLFLVALGIDYTIFLMTRAREDVGRLGHRDGILHAVTVTGGVITSAGLVLAATFSVLAVLPRVSLLQLGLIVAIGVLIDTLVVRTLLVPALSIDIGRRIWWPGRLASATSAPATSNPAEAGVEHSDLVHED